MSCTLSKGQGLIIRGKNGCGKSTFLRLIAGLLSPTQGVIEIDPSVQIAFLGHLNALKPSLTVNDHFSLSCNMTSQKPTPNFIEKTVKTYGLLNHLQTPVAYLSAGFQRRVALVRFLLMGHEKLWILDEPLANLDEATTTLFIETLRTHLDKGNSVVLSSHSFISVPNTKELWLNG